MKQAQRKHPKVGGDLLRMNAQPALLAMMAESLRSLHRPPAIEIALTETARHVRKGGEGKNEVNAHPRTMVQFIVLVRIESVFTLGKHPS